MFDSTGHLTLYLYPDFEQAGHNRHFRYPTLGALAGGYSERKDQVTYVHFSGSGEKCIIDCYANGSFVRRSLLETEEIE